MKPPMDEAVRLNGRIGEIAAYAPPPSMPSAPNWIANATILWQRRRLLLRVAAISLLLSLLIAFTLPKRYKSSARIMPPSGSNIGTAMIAALAGRALGGFSGIGNLAGSLLGGNNTSALFVDLLRSGTISGHLIDDFDLQRIYHKRYRIDTAKYLAHHTAITDDKKTGVITITVDDTNPRRARDLAQAYLDQLNLLVNHTGASSAHQERVFIEKRLTKVKTDLEDAEQRMSTFSSTHATVDIKEQTRAMVDAGAKLQAQMIVEESSLNSLRQIYGDQNVRVRAAQARIAVLQRQLSKMSGSSAPLTDSVSEESSGETNGDASELYPPLRQLPRLAVPYTNLYRQVQIQEAVFELLTQQYELARIQEAKDVPVVSVIDAPGIPEKKSFPPRLLLTLLLTLFSIGATCALVLMHHRWSLVRPEDPRKRLAAEIAATLRASLKRKETKREALQ
jgi:uncharacterized protein involved in exopolysaccharide biosynthesis